MDNKKINNEINLTGKDMLIALKLIMDTIRARGKDRKPEEDAQDWERVYRFAKAGAALNNAECMHWIAEMTYGQKVAEARALENPVQEAAWWWEQAFEAGIGRSATNLGLLHQGKPIPGAGYHGSLEIDQKKALDYFIKGYENGDIKAGRHIGLCYQNGLGVEVDHKIAYGWFIKSAERGDSSSALFVADYLLEGKGVSQNIPEAISRYQALIDCKGHDVTTAAFALGKIYSEGKYAPVDKEKAKVYFESVIKTATGKEQDIKAEAEEYIRNNA